MWAAIILGAAVGTGTGRQQGSAHSCLEVDRISPPSTVAGSCTPHDPGTHLCSVHPLTEANLSITQCTELP